MKHTPDWEKSAGNNAGDMFVFVITVIVVVTLVVLL